MKRSIFARIPVGILTLLLAASLSRWSASARADDPPAIEGATLVSRNPLETSTLLGRMYKKEAEGFRLTPPAGARVIERQGIDLMSFIVDAKSWGGSLQLIPLKNPMSLAEFVEMTKRELQSGKDFLGAQVLEDKLQKQDDKPAARLAFSLVAELGPGVPSGVAEKMGIKDVSQKVTLFRQQLVVQTRSDAQNKSSQFLNLTFYTPLKDRDVAVRTFNAMLSEFELYDPAAIKQKRVAAVAAGKRWLGERSAEEFASKMINQTQYFRMTVNGDEVGFFQFDEFTREPDPKGNPIDVVRDGRRGVFFAVMLRSFPSDGSLISGGNAAFWANSRDTKGSQLGLYATWNNMSRTRARRVLPASRGAPARPATEEVTAWLQETGNISQAAPAADQSPRPYDMMVTFGGDKTQHLPGNLAQRIPLEGPAPLPEILKYSWPRFVTLTKPSEMSFVVYNSAQQKLTLCNLIVSGKKENVNIDGKVTPCFKCVSEMDPNATTLWVDEEGRIRMMVTSDQSVMLPTTLDAIKRKWGSRLDDQ